MAAKKKTETAITRADLRNSANAGSAVSLVPEGFQDAKDFQMPEGAEIKVMSPMIRPVDFPVGKVLVGVFTKIFQTTPGKNEDGTDKKGFGVEIVPEGAQVGIALAAVATLKGALNITGTSMEDVKSPYLGRTIAVQRSANRLPSKKGNDAWHFLVAILPDAGKGSR